MIVLSLGDLSVFVGSFVIFRLYWFKTVLLLGVLSFFLYINWRQFYYRDIRRFLLVAFIVGRLV